MLKKIEQNNHLPIQKCISGHSVKDLSDIELLAVILGTGSKHANVLNVAASIYHMFKGLSGLHATGIRELASIGGIGMTKAIKILCALEIGTRIISSCKEYPEIDTPVKVWQLLCAEIIGLKQECFIVLLLDNKNRLIKTDRISLGTLSETIAHPREIFKQAIRESASSIIVAHNHPSGTADPSEADILLTDRIQQAGDIIGIPLLDHVILTEKSYLSLKERGFIPF